jgi:hypothetical protein
MCMSMGGFVAARYRAGALIAAALALGSCTPEAKPGDVGTLRYAGRVKGEAPLRLLPPVSDPAGNVYVLNGAIDFIETRAFVGFAAGGWSATCALTKGDQFGAHGWAGFATSRQWYWSGGALVSVSGESGECHAVVDKDPATGADLSFVAVMPSIRNLSERTTLVALVQSPTDPAPYTTVVDLEGEFLTEVQPFTPPDATDVAVVGVGGDRTRELGVALVQYRQKDAAKLELRSYDASGTLFAVRAVPGGPYAPYAVPGYLQIDADGLVAGLLPTGEKDAPWALLTVDDRGGKVVPITNMEAIGVHVWEGQLWLVGSSNGKPVVAAIAAGRTGPAQTWQASLATAAALGAVTPVRDDRSLPSRETSWTNVRSAVGPFPFLSAHALTQHAASRTLWVFAGPTIQGSALPLTAFAAAPIGVSYP